MRYISIKEIEEQLMKTKKKDSVFGRYPCCDLVNNAIRFILDGKPDIALEELAHAIVKADGYFHEDIAEIVKEKMNWQ